MTYSSEKDNQSSRKFSLVRIEPARWINDSLTNNGDGTYSVTLQNFIISKVQENGVNLTLVTTSPGNGEYAYNESSSVLTINPINSPSSTNSIVAFYYLFYTSQRTRSTTQDPEDSSTTTRDWLPRIETSPSVSQSVENIDKGFFEIDSSKIDLINNNGEFNTYLSDHDSFFNKEVKAWFCIDDTSNIQKAFFGLITSINLTKRIVTLNIENNFSKISLPATMGDSRQYTYFNAQDYSSLDPAKAGTPIPFFFGRTSRYHLRDVSSSDATAFSLDLSSMPEAVCTVYSASSGTDKNRVWGLGRIASSGLQQDVYSISTSFHGNPQYTRLTITNPSTIFAGDVGKCLIGSSGTEYVRVMSVDSANSYVFLDKTSVVSFTSLTLNGVSIGVAQDGDNKLKWYYPYEGRDYTIGYETTEAGNSYVKITFANNFEANLVPFQTLNPSDHQVKFRVKPKHSKAGHGETLRYILSKVGGLSLNESTFSAADTSLVTNVAFSIPFFDESDFADYTKYVGELLQSTFGYLRLNNSFEVEYGLFDTPSSSGTSITNAQIIYDSMQTEIDYKDLVDQIVAYNPHYSSADGHADQSGVSASSNKAKYLHGIDRTTRFVHVLESMSTRLTGIMNSRSSRKGTYKLETKTLNLDSLIGQDYVLAYNTIDGNSTAPCKIVRMDKSPGKVGLILSDLVGV